MPDTGIKVYKRNTPFDNKNLKNFFINSERVLVKIHKQGSFTARYVRNSGVTVTIRFDDLPYRPFVLVYCQRVNHDDPTPAVDTDYHFLEWSYFGAITEGYQRVKIFKGYFELFYRDTLARVDDGIWDVFGYYYVFKENIDG